MKNCIRLKNHNPFTNTYAYLDTEEYLADQLFINKKLRVKFLRDYSHENDPYIIVMVKVPKSRNKDFLCCMNELNKKMLLTGNTNYNKFSIMERILIHGKERQCE